MAVEPLRRGFLSERVWPVVRVLLLQLLLATSIVVNLGGWLLLVLVVDRLHWLQLDFHGKTLVSFGPDGMIIGGIIVLSVNLCLVLLAWRLLERKPLCALQWECSRRAWRPLTWGLAAGLAEVALVFGLMTALGVAHSTWGLAAVPPSTGLLALGWLLMSSALAPIVEEAMYRGYWFQNIRRGWGVTAAALVPSLLFGGFHLLNPNAQVLGALNIALCSLAYVLGLRLLRSLWFPIGWHAAWNLAQFFVAGLPNSGMTVRSLGLQGTTVLSTTLAGPSWLTGRDFGMEASVVKTVVMAAAVAVMWWVKARREQSATALP